MPGVGYAPANQFSPSSEIHESQVLGVSPSPCALEFVMLNPSGLYKSIKSIGINDERGKLIRVYSPGLMMVGIELSATTMY